MAGTPPRTDGEQLPFIGGQVRISERQTHGTYCLLEASAPGGDEAPLHVHVDDDEGFFLLEGMLVVEVGGQRIRLEPGMATLAPRGVPHRWTVASAEGARWLNTSGGGLERFARAASDPGDQPLHDIAGQHGIRFL